MAKSWKEKSLDTYDAPKGWRSKAINDEDKKNFNQQDVMKFLNDVYYYIDGLKTELTGGASADLSNYIEAAAESIIYDRDYSKALEIVRQDRENFANQYGGSAALASIAGGFISGAGVGGMLTKGAVKLLAKVAPQAVSKIPKAAKFISSVAGTAATGGIEGGTSEMARTGEEGAFERGAKRGAAWGAALGTPFAALSRGKKYGYAFESLNPSKAEYVKINKSAEAAKNAANAAKQMMDFGVVKFYRTREQMHKVLRGSRKLSDYVVDNYDELQEFDASDVLEESGGLIGKKAKQIDDFLKRMQDLWHDSYRENPEHLSSMYDDLVTAGVDPEAATKRIMSMKELGHTIFGDEMLSSSVDDVISSLKKKELQFASPSEISNLLNTLNHITGQSYGLTLPEAQKLKKTIGKMIFQTDWEKLPPELSAKKTALKAIYKTVKEEIEDVVDTGGRDFGLGDNLGEVLKRSNKELGGLLYAGKILDSSIGSEQARRASALAPAITGTMGGAVAYLANPNLATAGIGAAMGLGATAAARTYGSQAMATMHDVFGTQAGRSGLSTSIHRGAESLFPKARAADVVETIERSADGTIANKELFSKVIEVNRPDLLNEFNNSIYSGDKHSISLMSGDLYPLMEMFIEPSPLKVNGSRIKSAVKSSRFPNSLEITSDAERDVVARSILDDSTLKESEKAQKLLKLNKYGVIDYEESTPEVKRQLLPYERHLELGEQADEEAYDQAMPQSLEEEMGSEDVQRIKSNLKDWRRSSPPPVKFIQPKKPQVY